MIFAKVVLLLLQLYCVLSQTDEVPNLTCNVDLSIQKRMDQIGTNILTKLGMKEAPPNPKLPVHVPAEKLSEFMVAQETENIRTASDETCTQAKAFSREKRVSFASRIRVFESDPKLFESVHPIDDSEKIGKRDAHSSPFFHVIPPSVYQLHFPIDLTSQKMFTSAELLIFKERVKSIAKARTKLVEMETVQISFIYTTYHYHNSYLVKEDKREIVDTRIVRTDVDEFEPFDVTNAVKKWMYVNQYSTGEIQLEVTIRCPVSLSTNRPYPPLIEFDTSKDSSNRSAQFILTFVRPQERTDMSTSSSSTDTSGNRGSGRKKRQAITRLDTDFCFNEPTEVNCCVRELTIDFADDLGWTWVMMPLQYKPNYCLGLCPFLWPTISNSTIFQQLLRERNPTSAAEPCCASDNLKPLTVLFSFAGELFVQQFNDMILETCICR